LKAMAGMVAKVFSSDPFLGDGQSPFFINTRCDSAPEKLVKIVFADNITATPDGLFVLFITTDHSPHLREKKNTQNRPLYY